MGVSRGPAREAFNRLAADRQLDMQAFVKHNRRFQQAIVTISGNQELAALIDRYQLAVFIPLLERVVGPGKLIPDSLSQNARNSGWQDVMIGTLS